MKKQIVFLLAMLFVLLRVNAQTESIIDIATVRSEMVEGYTLSPQILNFTFNEHFAEYAVSSKRLQKAKLFIELSHQGVISAGSTHVAEVSLPVSLNTFSNPILTISESETKSVFTADITSEYNDLVGVGANPFHIQWTNPNNNLQIKIWTEAKYQLNPTSITQNTYHQQPSNTLQIANKRVVDFKWNHTVSSSKTLKYVPGYEFQLMRVFNEDESRKEEGVNANGMTGAIDWENAMKFYIENRDDFLDGIKTLPITVAEGKGLYVWRVRAVGNFYDGFFANDKNFGEWSIITSQFDFADAKNPGEKGFFYLEDPDDGRNWIYGRTFSEENKIRESIGYANTLLQPTQSQTYLPSQKQTFVTQSIYDYKGRPAMSTLPMPKNPSANDDGLNGYKVAHIKDKTNGDVYRDEDLDKANPEKVLTTPTESASYYENNSRVAIGSAQEYPYTITRFLNDGSGRVEKQSGVGLVHNINSDHTTDYNYGTANDDELVRIFGDEAPNGEKIKKTSVRDANGVITITYTNLAGNVIATAVANDNGNSVFGSDDDIVTSGEQVTVTDRLTNSYEDNEGNFVSSKRILFVECTPVTISYTPASAAVQVCGMTEDVPCDYQIEVIIHNLKDPSQSIKTGQLPSGTSTFVNADFTYLSNGADYNPPSCSSLPVNTVWLEAGSYLVEKKTIPVRSSNSSAMAAINKAVDDSKKRIRNVSKKITDDLSEIETEEDYNDFISDNNCVIYKYVTWTVIEDGESVTKWDHIKIKCSDITNGTYDYANDDNFKYVNGSGVATQKTVACTGGGDVLDFPTLDPTDPLYGKQAHNQFCKESGDILVYTPAPEDLQNLVTVMEISSECCDLRIPVIYLPNLSCPHLGKMRDFVRNYTSNSSGQVYDESLEAVFETKLHFSRGLVDNNGFDYFDLGFMNYAFTLFNSLGIISDPSGNPISPIAGSGRKFITLDDINALSNSADNKLAMWPFFESGNNAKIAYFPTDDPGSTTDDQAYINNFNEYVTDFDEMAYHMINDRYRANDKPNSVFEEQYNCDELMNCWVGALNAVINARLDLDGDYVVEDPMTEMNKDEEVDFEINEDEIKKAVDDAFKKMRFGWLLKIFGKKKREKAIEDAVNEARQSVNNSLNKLGSTVGGGVDDVEINSTPMIMDMFFDCTDLKLARVLNSTSNSGGNYICTADDESNFTDGIINQQTYLDVDNYVYNYDGRDESLFDNSAVNGFSNGNLEKFKRIYLFKYFVYDGSHTGCNVDFCFCEEVEVPCNHSIYETCDSWSYQNKCAGVNHLDWDFAKRAQFFTCVKKDLAETNTPLVPEVYAEMTCDGTDPVNPGSGVTFPHIEDAAITLEQLHTDLVSDAAYSICQNANANTGVNCESCLTEFYTLLKTQYPSSVLTDAKINEAFVDVLDLGTGATDYQIKLDQLKCRIVSSIYHDVLNADVVEFMSVLNGGHITWQDLENETLEDEERCKRECTEKQPEFKTKVKQMFKDNCWTLVTLTCEEYQPWEVPYEDVDQIVMGLEEQCKQMCELDFVAAQSKVCWSCATDPDDYRRYVEVHQGSPEELKRWRAIMEGSFELDIASWCGENGQLDNNLQPFTEVTTNGTSVLDYNKCIDGVESTDIRSAQNLDYNEVNHKNGGDPVRCEAEDTQLNGNTLFDEDTDGDGQTDKSKTINLEVEIDIP